MFQKLKDLYGFLVAKSFQKEAQEMESLVSDPPAFVEKHLREVRAHPFLNRVMAYIDNVFSVCIDSIDNPDVEVSAKEARLIAEQAFGYDDRLKQNSAEPMKPETLANIVDGLIMLLQQKHNVPITDDCVTELSMAIVDIYTDEYHDRLGTGRKFAPSTDFSLYKPDTPESIPDIEDDLYDKPTVIM